MVGTTSGEGLAFRERCMGALDVHVALTRTEDYGEVGVNTM